MTERRQLRLGAFMRPVSIHTAWWRYPGAYPDANFNFRHLASFAQTLERGKFDAFFMADHLALLNMPMNALKRSATTTSFDPLTLLPALAVVTERLGLIATASTTFNDPYHIARKFASLDHISNGRAGWNSGDHLQSRRRDSISASKNTSNTRRAIGKPASSTMSSPACGTVGRMTLSSAMSRMASFSIRSDACAESQRAPLLGSRPAEHRPSRPGLAGHRPGRARRKPAGRLPLKPRRWSSPPAVLWPTPSHSTPTSKAAWNRSAAIGII